MLDESSSENNYLEVNPKQYYSTILFFFFFYKKKAFSEMNFLSNLMVKQLFSDMITLQFQ